MTMSLTCYLSSITLTTNRNYDPLPDLFYAVLLQMIVSIFSIVYLQMTRKSCYF